MRRVPTIKSILSNQLLFVGQLLMLLVLVRSASVVGREQRHTVGPAIGQLLLWLTIVATATSLESSCRITYEKLLLRCTVRYGVIILLLMVAVVVVVVVVCGGREAGQLTLVCRHSNLLVVCC